LTHRERGAGRRPARSGAAHFPKLVRSRMTADREKNVLERLLETNPEAEIWWDSSPLVYPSWAAKTTAKAPAHRKDIVAAQVGRMFDTNRLDTVLFRGVTTNPPLSHNVMKDDPTRWAGFVREQMRAYPDASVEEIYWRTYKEFVRLGAEYMRPIFDASEHRYGYISGQVDPRSVFDEQAMLAQALEIAALGPNVMVKVPGSREGYAVIEELTARGIATNNTLSFCVPQFVACMDAVCRGLARAKANGVALGRFRSVITHMSARYGSLGDLEAQAKARGITLTESDVRWAELAIFKRAYKMTQERADYPGKMLMCSMRMGPDDGSGQAESWHIHKIAGSDVVYTCPPGYISELMDVAETLKPFDPKAIDEEPPADAMAKLTRLPYFTSSYEPDGLTPEQFNSPRRAHDARWGSSPARRAAWWTSSTRSSRKRVVADRQLTCKPLISIQRKNATERSLGPVAHL
jgi:transaldolase